MFTDEEITYNGENMSKPVILTGLRANNDLHLGNYLGALLPMVQLQKKYAGEYQINLFVPDLHSFTTPIDHSKLYEQTIQNTKLFVAAGLDLGDPDTFIYRQSTIPAHSELTVILNCFTYMGELSRMTQYKEKGEVQSNVSAGLFDYPVLMAADILLYGAKYVPVGADQTQHVELARDIAIRMNNKFGDLFTPPAAEKEQIAFASQQERLRIRDLASPEKKMSKSDDTGKGVIFLGDSPEAAAKKIMSAATDSYSEIKYDHQERPGISNLLDILAALTDKPVEKVIAEYEGQTQYGPLKSAVAEAVKTFLTNFQQSLQAVDEAELAQKLEASESAMNTTAQDTLRRVQKAVGLRA
jgi:tryptophanyl-tRNA synthetase